MNHSELASFLAVLDLSFSMFARLTADAKRNLLRTVIPAFIAERHRTFLAYGYSPVSLQSKADSFSHKRSGQSGTEKISDILRRLGIPSVADATVKGFQSMKTGFARPDAQDASLFDDVKAALGLKFSWGRQHAGKYPDFCIKAHRWIAIGEHKHIKESGGGQDKQLLELIAMIDQDESTSKHVLYVSFLDGAYFSSIFAAETTGKIKNQRDMILRALDRHPRSFFVNAHGFERLLAQLTAS